MDRLGGIPHATTQDDIYDGYFIPKGTIVMTNVRYSSSSIVALTFVFLINFLFLWVNNFRPLHQGNYHHQREMGGSLILMQISNLFIKSSMHTSLNIFAAALFFSLSPTLGFIWLIIAIIVGITRVILKRHTPKEVIMGAFLGSLVSFFYLYVFIQNQQIL